MSTLRRLISLCLTLAFASYGLIAAAPAHAHDHNDETGYAIHAVSLDVDHHDDHHDQDRHEALDNDEGLSSNGTAPVEHNDVHVHAVASFTTVSGSAAVPELISTAVMNRTEQPVVRVTGHFAPLKKPPRIFL